MLKDNVFEALMWAHRYCVDYQGGIKDDGVTRVFLKEIQSKFGPHLSGSQTSRLLTDLNRHIEWQEKISEQYPEEALSQAVYEYRDYLEDQAPYVWDDEDTLPSDVSLFKIVYWAAMYCITRGSYAASYGSDVVKFLPGFTRAECSFLLAQLRNYILSSEARARLWEQDHKDCDYGISRTFLPDECWYDLRDYLSGWLGDCLVNVHAVADSGSPDAWIKCFIDKNGQRRPIDSYLKRPGSHAWIPEEMNKEEIPVIGPADMSGTPVSKLDEKELDFVESMLGPEAKKLYENNQK